MTATPKFLYACYGKAGLDCLYQLLNQKECNSKKILVITYDNEENRNLVKHLRCLKIEFLTKNVNTPEVTAKVQDFSPDYMFSIYFRDIIKKKVLKAVRISSVNLHPSLLPDYKGCFSIPWAILNNEKRAGISYHLMDEGVDTGAIVLQKELEICEHETAFSLFNRLVALGVKSFEEMFHLIVREGYKGVPQKPTGCLYKRAVPYGGYFSLDMGKEKIDRFIRAMYFPDYAGAKLNFKGEVFEFHTPKEFEDFCKSKAILL